MLENKLIVIWKKRKIVIVGLFVKLLFVILLILLVFEFFLLFLLFLDFCFDGYLEDSNEVCLL